MRRFLSIAALVVTTLGLIMLVRLAHRASQTSPAVADSGDTPARIDRIVATSERTVPKPPPTLGRIGGSLPTTLVDPRLLAEKSRRTLTVFSDGKPVKTYRIALGDDPVRPKEREGDGRTPEGMYYVCAKNPDSRFHRSLGLSYPSAIDAERGSRDGLIGARDRRAIVDAIRHFRQPPWNTKLGGEIMIHGGGTARDWTEGCLAVSNADIDEFYALIPLGTEVEIRP